MARPPQQATLHGSAQSGRARGASSRTLLRIVAAAAAAAVVVGLLLLVAFRVLGERSLWLILVGGVPPALVQLAMTTAAVAVALLVGRRRRLLSVALVAAVTVAVARLLTPSSSPPPSPTGERAGAGPALRVAAWNIAKVGFGEGGVVAGIAALDADVVCLSEAGRYHWLTEVDSARLPALLDDRWTLVGTSEVRALVRRGVTVLSTTEHPLPPGPASRPLLVLRVQQSPPAAGVGAVTVACLHLMPKLLFLPSSVDRGAAENGSWREIAAAAWQQGRQLRDVVTTLPWPLVVGGDFNNVAHGGIVGGLRELGLRDALLDGGAGPLSTTFSDSLRGKRIDHLLVSPDVAAASARVVDIGGSNHRPVVVDLTAR